MAGFSKRARRVKLAIFDVDGVFTDGTLYFGMDGKELLKAFNILDGHGVKMLQAGGVRTAILSGRKSGAVAARGRQLGIGDVIQGEADKLAPFERLLRTDATLELVPSGARAQGNAACVALAAPSMDRPGAWRMAPTHANGQPAARAWWHGHGASGA